MPEERKPAPLPPLPWIWESSRYGWISLFDANNKLIARVDGDQPAAAAIADLFCRAPALESELHAAREQAKFALEFLNERDSARSLLHDLTAAVRALDGEIPYTTGWKRSRETMMILLRLAESLLRRAEAEAGEESANE